MTTTLKPIDEFQIIDHGIEHPDYFQGCGTAFTSFADVATGIGSNPAEAIDDCLEQLAQQGYETEGMVPRILADIERDRLPTRPTAKGDAYYHVSIRVK